LEVILLLVSEIMTQAKEILGVDPSILSSIKSLIVSTIDFIRTRYGDIGLLAAVAVFLTPIVLLFQKVISLAFATVRYLIIPAILLAVLGDAFLENYSFMECLPITSIACTLYLVAKA